MKKSIILILSAVMVVASAMTAFAGVQSGTTFRYGDTKIYEGTDSLGNKIRYSSGPREDMPGWKWINGYCYYFQSKNPFDIAKSKTTPDGYQVDAEGRWVVGGVPQYNGYGSFRMGTDALYNGKSDEEIWATMKGQLEELFANNIPGDPENPFGAQGMYSGPYSVQSVGGVFYIIHANDGLNPYISAHMPNNWNDSPDTYANMWSETYEKAIKLIVGDKVGQELFNDIKAAGDPCVAGGTTIKYDANGNPISIKKPVEFDGETIYVDAFESIEVPSKSDGVNWSLFNNAKWQNRKTDYGKTFSTEIVPINGINEMHIIIK